jgi:hypothetical protein
VIRGVTFGVIGVLLFAGCAGDTDTSATLSDTQCTPAPDARCDGADLAGADLAGRDLVGITLRVPTSAEPTSRRPIWSGPICPVRICR